MLSACIKSEQLKLRRTPLWAAFLIAPFIPAILGTQNYLNNLDLLKSEWFSLWTQETLFYSNFFFAPLIAVYCSYLWRMENRNKNRYALLTAPVPVRNIILGKLIITARVTLLTQLWVYVLFIISGKLTGLAGFPPAATLYYVFRGLLGGMVIVSLQLLLSMMIRSFAAPIVIAILGSITGLLAANSSFGILYPYSLLMLGMNANRTEDMLTGSSLPFVMSSVFYLVLFTALAAFLLKRRDVKA